MWLNYGKKTIWASFALILGFFLLPGAADSPAYAGLLKNSVRVGDRSAMTILKRPRPGQRQRIRAAAPRGTATTPPPQRAELGWFWDDHSVSAAAASPERWSGALASLRRRRAGGEALYSAERLQRIAEQYGPQIAAAARTHRVSELLVVAVIAVESAGRQKAVSPKGARGLMQLIPATARRFGVGNSFDPAQNIGGGAAYLDWLLNRYRGDPILALAGYNAGEGAVDKHKGVPPYSETRDYVVRVFDALAAAEALCKSKAVTPRHRCGWPSSPAS
ncbi:MAG: lytic transglycosylase domain-containing protein [Paracoccaceae bacterium]|nr:lytic transglycosylase domain-containing protein [Paracoccaceae bacterium]